jgi:hypothetical protein
VVSVVLTIKIDYLLDFYGEKRTLHSEEIPAIGHGRLCSVHMIIDFFLYVRKSFAEKNFIFLYFP